jgi:hypothetical protein
MDPFKKQNEKARSFTQSQNKSFRIPDPSGLEDYGTSPDFVDLYITEEVVEQVPRRLSGSAGPGGSDAQSIQHWLLYFGGESQALQKAVCKLADWLVNDQPLWAAYQAVKVYRRMTDHACTRMSARTPAIGDDACPHTSLL